MTSKSTMQKQTTWWQSIREIAFLLIIIFAIRTFFFGLYQVPTGSMEVTMLVGERFFGDKLTMWLRDPKRGEIVAFNDVQYPYSSNPLVRLFQEYVWGPLNLTKRVIGVPGDHVRGVIEDGKPVIYINDERLNEPYLNPYPLLGVWKPDFKFISYDPSKPYEQQSFYRITPSMIARVKPGTWDPNFTITEDGRVLEMPGLPITTESHTPRMNRGKNYWNGSDEFDVILGPNQYWAMGDNRRGSKDSRFFGPVTKPHALIRLRIWSIDSDAAWWILDLLQHPVDFWTRMRWSRWFNWLS